MSGQSHIRCIILVGVVVLGSVHLFMLALISRATREEHRKCLSSCLFINHYDSVVQPSNICSHNELHIELLILVHSAIRHDQHRIAIRKYTSLLQYKWKVVFVLGRSSKGAVNRQIQMESAKFGDILQGDFIDTYRNLTLKHLSGLTWTAIHCSQVSSILKVDDDIFVNYFLLKQFLAKLPTMNLGKDYLIGYLHHDMNVIRNNASKWYVTQAELSTQHYPPFCSGWAYITTVDTIKSLLCEASGKSLFWIDDVYVTGLLRPECVQLRAINHLFNVDLATLNRWLQWKRQVKWYFLFSNTDNEVTLLNALDVNHDQHKKRIKSNQSN